MPKRTLDMTEFRTRPLVERPPEAAARRRLLVQTAEANADILTSLRATVRNQLTLVKQQSSQNIFDDKQASALLKLAQTYALLDSRTEREHAKYDLSALTDEELERIERDFTGNSGEKSGT